MQVLEMAQTIETTDSVIIEDKDKGIKWIIFIEKLNGKFVKIREAINPDYFKDQGSDYMHIVYKLAMEATGAIAGQVEPPFMPKITEVVLRQLFKNNSDCYTKVSLAENNIGECYVNKQALSEDGFIKLLNKLNNFQNNT